MVNASKETEWSLARKMFFSNANVTPDQIQEAWIKAGNKKSSKIKGLLLSQLKQTLNKKWSKYADEFKKLPRDEKGNLDVNATVSIIKSKSPEMSHEDCSKLLASEGVNLSGESLKVKRHYNKKIVAPVETKRSYVRKNSSPTEAKRKYSRKIAPTEIVSINNESKFLKLEAELDSLIKQTDSKEISNWLIAARRNISAAILSS